MEGRNSMRSALSFEVEAAVNALNIQPSDNLDNIPFDTAHLAVVQLLCRHFTSLSEYVGEMNRLVSDAVNQRAHLICFPAFAGMLPLPFLPEFSKLEDSFRLGPNGLPNFLKLSDALAFFSAPMMEVFQGTMSALAMKHRIYILAGSAIHLDNHRTFCHRAFLFDDTGSLAGYQDKVSASLLERELGIEEAGEVKLLETPVGPLSILIGGDVNLFETVRVAKNLGAQMILNPSVFPGERSPVDDADGLNLRVQENPIYGVQIVMVGDTGLGFQLTGNACVYAPLTLYRSHAKNGIQMRSSGLPRSELLLSRLNLASLAGIRDPYRQDTNPELMAAYIEKLY
ncbi:MAG: nitrilase-related carbon-nitrogen hydrolase [Oscillospiraceae bacterium]